MQPTPTLAQPTTEPPDFSENYVALPEPAWTRQAILSRVRAVREQLTELFAEIQVYNRDIRSADEPRLDPDPDSSLRLLLKGADDMIAKEAISQMTPEEGQWMHGYIQRMIEHCGSARFAETIFLHSYMSEGVPKVPLGYDPSECADAEYMNWD